MNFRRFATKRTLAIGAAVLVVAAGAGAAIAATSGVFDPKAEQEAFPSAVADKLGVTTTELQNAYKAAALERLDSAVAAGRITKEQAEAMRTRIESGDFMGPRGMFGGTGMHGLRGPGRHVDAAADYLGLTEAELRDKIVAGQSLAAVAKAQGKSVDGLKQALIADAKTKLDQAFEDGKITAVQRDEMLERLTSRIDDMVNRTGPPDHGPGFGRPFGHGFGGPPDV